MDEKKKKNKLPFRIRVAKEDAVFLYQLLESYENVMNFSTLTSPKEAAYRDIALYSSPAMEEEREEVLSHIGKSIQILRLE